MHKIESWSMVPPQQNKSREEIVINAKLKMIDNLFEEIENSADRIVMQEIINNYSDIISIQKEKIEKLNGKLQELSVRAGVQQKYTPMTEKFVNDEQIKNAFTAYLSFGAKKQLSTYTINDYISRIKNLWTSFYSNYNDDEELKKSPMFEGICISLERVIEDSPLLNAYNHTHELNQYIGYMRNTTDKSRNWANTQAALNKFEEFIYSSKMI